MSEKTSRTTVLCHGSTCLPRNCSREKSRLCQQHPSGPQPQHTPSELRAAISPRFLPRHLRGWRPSKATAQASLRAETRMRYLRAHRGHRVLRVRHRRLLPQQNRLTRTAKTSSSAHSPPPHHLSILICTTDISQSKIKAFFKQTEVWRGRLCS